MRVPTEDEIEATDIDSIMEALASSGNTGLLTTFILAASSVTAVVSWCDKRFTCLLCPLKWLDEETKPY